MGIESDQVVYEYLSRVGDVAHQRQLPSATRMRLVSELRDEIDRRRARAAVDSPAAVRRILDHLGSPVDVVEAAGGSAATGPGPRPPAAVPVQPAPGDRRPEGHEGAGKERPKGLRRVVPRPRPAVPETPAAPRDAASPPHLAAAHELGDGVAPPDWWRVGSGPFGGPAGGPLAEADAVPGFVGGVEIPELLKRPPKETEPVTEAAPEADAVAAPAPRRRLFSRRTPDAEAPARRLLPGPAAGWSNPLLLLAAAALVAGAVLGNWFALLLGWVIAYGSRRLSAAETKTAVMVIPGTAVAGGLVWLWGRQNGRWGEPIGQDHMADAISGTWPWVVRGAALTSALYLAWRSQRTR
ncbi:hypothetical protein SAMN05428944_3645 [Streptomyces sp. 1222.5]|uniref:hypothetical protein n=1 Tax=unclassified Streptomyces TaxID=2593676 RepID=UPI000899448C|nr:MULTISPECIES: hypothetical protein [unclassified Streptomyces]PKW09201.1 hypothetical protein BX260_4448 [Streptomyces sp. 5112.2]SEC41819.1 hypothetical protein SAMN05428944_3645 [Streptomyces sp. 1222.5]